MKNSSRTIRIFISSTFLDFEEEREMLVKRVFPELRRKCRERQVELVDIDLRWGIKKEDALQGKVLPICLAEIDRSQPYFIGFIGERYGWIPASDHYAPSTLQKQPWLEEHRGGKSVTELEILHGVLNNPDIAKRAFFYFRDPKYALAKGGVFLGECSEEQAKLNNLKDRIRKSGFPIVEDYPTPETLAEKVRDELWTLIEQDFPLAEVPDALTIERSRHENYGATRLAHYMGGETYFAALDGAMAKSEANFQPVLITGGVGVGKTAMLVNWLGSYRKVNSNSHVIVHHLNASSEAADPVRMVQRLVGEILEVTGDQLELKYESDEILEQLTDVLNLAAAYAEREGQEWVIILDGMDKISSHQHLSWFPQHLPRRVKLVVSCAEGRIKESLINAPSAESLEDLMRICDLPSEEVVDQGLLLNWIPIEIKPLAETQRRELIINFLMHYSKSLEEQLIVQILDFPLSLNPLFLKTLLEELRIFGSYEEVAHRLNTLLSKPPSKNADENYTVDDLFEHILSRIEKDTGKTVVVAVLKAVWASRMGLTRDELLAFTGTAPAKWAEMENALDENLLEIGGLITFGNEFFRKAVQDMYLPGEDDPRSAHQELAEWFENQEITRRVFLETVWQWQKSEMWHKLVSSAEVRATLAQIEDDVLVLRFGLKGGKVHSVEQVGHLLGVSPDRVDHLQKKALRKLRHLDRIRKLDGFISLPGMTYDGFATDTDLHGKV
jgi:nephrocystin-3